MTTDLTMTSHEMQTASNGIRLITEHMPGMQCVSLSVWIPVGSRNESTAEAGSSHFVEHMLFKGNARMGAEDISRWFDNVGADANAATAKEYTVVGTKVLERDSGDALKVLGDMVFRPLFSPDEVEAERNVILDEIAMVSDSPSEVVHELADVLTFGDHDLGRPIAGSVESVSAISATSLSEFHSNRYQPGGIVITAVGNVDRDHVFDAVETIEINGVSGGRSNIAADYSSGSADVHRHEPSERRSVAMRRETEQVHVCFTGGGISRSSEKRHALAVLDTVLGATAGSRLFREIRERQGLAYSIYSFFTHYRETGQVGIYAATRPEKFREVLETVRKELISITAELCSDDELALAKNHLERRMLIALDGTGARSSRLGGAQVLGIPLEPIEESVRLMKNTTKDDLRVLAEELFSPDQLSIAVVADDFDSVRDDIAQTMGVDTVYAEGYEDV